MGSDWLAGPVCCDSSLVRVQSPSPQCCIVNNDVVNIAYQFEPIETQRILVKRITQNLCKRGSYRMIQNGMVFLFVVFKYLLNVFIIVFIYLV